MCGIPIKDTIQKAIYDWISKLDKEWFKHGRFGYQRYFQKTVDHKIPKLDDKGAFNHGNTSSLPDPLKDTAWDGKNVRTFNHRRNPLLKDAIQSTLNCWTVET